MDRVPIHNVAASIASSAGSWLMSIDRSKQTTEVPTATLIMWLEVIVGQMNRPQEVESAARNVVMGHFARVDEEARARDEDNARKGAY